ncbi:MAG: ferredoxin family protein [Chloroflexi bacterium]|nr:ferredoxin family protein [Chloroflexota bacterium]
MRAEIRLEDKLYATKFKADEESHLIVIDQANCQQCVRKQCITTCPARCYSRNEDGRVVVAFEGCLECGTCRIVCNEFHNIDWRYPKGGFGVIYRYG